MKIDFRSLADVPRDQVIALMNDARVRRHLLFDSSEFSRNDYEAFITAKTTMWEEAGYGPWAIYFKDRFAGWGGFQPEGGEPDLGLVLHSDYWGEGKRIYAELLRRGFGEMGFDSITILLPPGRVHDRVIQRLGFEDEGKHESSGKAYFRYRLKRRPGG